MLQIHITPNTSNDNICTRGPCISRRCLPTYPACPDINNQNKNVRMLCILRNNWRVGGTVICFGAVTRAISSQLHPAGSDWNLIKSSKRIICNFFLHGRNIFSRKKACFTICFKLILTTLNIITNL